MRLSCTYAQSGLTVYAYIQRLTDSLYYIPATPAFGAWAAEANHQIALTEDTHFEGLYAVEITDGVEWTDAIYRVVYYVDAIAGADLIGENTFFVRSRQVVDDGDIYDFMMRIAGLSKENMYMDQNVYSGGNLTSGRIRLYADFPFTPGTDTPIATYTLSATYTGTNLSTWKLERQ